jgi:hypothetical protein
MSVDLTVKTKDTTRLSTAATSQLRLQNCHLALD